MRSCGGRRVLGVGGGRVRVWKILLSVLWLYWSRLRARRFDVAISPRWDVDDQLATFLCSLVDARKRVGYTETASSAKQRHNRGFDAAFNRSEERRVGKECRSRWSPY